MHIGVTVILNVSASCVMKSTGYHCTPSEHRIYTVYYYFTEIALAGIEITFSYSNFVMHKTLTIIIILFQNIFHTFSAYVLNVYVLLE